MRPQESKRRRDCETIQLFRVCLFFVVVFFLVVVVVVFLLKLCRVASKVIPFVSI